MKFNFFITLTFLLISSCTNSTEVNKTEISSNTVKEEITKQLRHVVLFKFKEDASAADIKKVEVAFAALPSKIKEIKDYEWGLNNSPEGLEKGFTHCFFLTFDGEEERAVYLPHPAHKAFGEVLNPFLDDVLVFDYWVN